MNVTEQATAQLKKVLVNYGQEGAGIRIFTSKGCCGPSIQMDVVKQPASNQTVLHIDNIDFFVDNDLLETLTTVTFEFGTRGFRLNGLPKVSDGCCS